MENIFENTYFSKPYKTRDNNKALLIKILPSGYYFLKEGGIQGYFVDKNGCHNDVFGENNNMLDIVSEWQVEINEEELEEYAESTSKSYWSDDMETFDGNHLEKEIYYVCRRCYKAGLKTGYRKAIEKYGSK